MQFLWFAVIILFAVIEMATSQLWSVWISFGAVAALIVTILNGAVWLQFLLFFIVWIMLSFALKPFISKLPDGNLHQ